MLQTNDSTINFVYHHHPSSVYNLTNTTTQNETRRGLHTNTTRPGKKDEKWAPKKRKMWMKQNIFPRHFYPCLWIKFFNPEKILNWVSLLLCKYAISTAATTFEWVWSRCKGKSNKICCFTIVTSHQPWKSDLSDFCYWNCGEVENVSNDDALEFHYVNNLQVKTNGERKMKRWYQRLQWLSSKLLWKSIKMFKPLSRREFSVNYRRL